MWSEGGIIWNYKSPPPLPPYITIVSLLINIKLWKIWDFTNSLTLPTAISKLSTSSARSPSSLNDVKLIKTGHIRKTKTKNILRSDYISTWQPQPLLVFVVLEPEPALLCIRINFNFQHFLKYGGNLLRDFYCLQKNISPERLQVVNKHDSKILDFITLIVYHKISPTWAPPGSYS